MQHSDGTSQHARDTMEELDNRRFCYDENGISNSTNSNSNSNSREAAAAAAAAAAAPSVVDDHSYLRLLRVTQLDAMQLDAELIHLLRAQFMKVFVFFKREHIDAVEPELDAFMHLIVYQLSVRARGASYGQSLVNLRYRDEGVTQSTHGLLSPLSKTQRILHGVFLIGGRWLYTRLNRLMINSSENLDSPFGTDESDVSTEDQCCSSSYSRMLRNCRHFLSSDKFRFRLRSTLTFAEKVYKTLNFINFVIFLRYGVYVTVIDRILRMRMVYNNKRQSRNVNFEFMNRQLLWHGFVEFLVFVVPLVNVQKLRNFAMRIFFSTSGLVNSVAVPTAICAICDTFPISIPYVTNCGHTFCYYCIKSNCLADSAYPCNRCGTIVTSVKPSRKKAISSNTSTSAKTTFRG